MSPLRRRKRTQQGGVLPLAAVIPALAAAGKTAALAALGGVVGHQTKKWLDAQEKRYKKRQSQRKIKK